MASYSRFAWIVLVPALALAGPKDHKKKKTDKAAEKKAADEAAEKKAADDAAAKEAKDAADAKEAATAKGLLSTGTVGGGGGGAGSGSTTGGGAGSGSGSGSGEAKGSGETQDKPAANEPDVDGLRQEYLALRDELFKSRARANAVASALYSTRVEIKFTWASGRYYGVSKASVRLDGATVYEDAAGAIAGDDGVRFDGYVAPGRHLITFHVEASGKDDDTFTSSTESQVVVKAVANKDLVVAAKAHDSGDIAYEWKRKERGSYGLGIDVSVKTAKPGPSGEAAPAAKTAAPKAKK
jgi:hypothetical protein